MEKNNEQLCYKMRKNGSDKVTLEKLEIERDLGVPMDKD